MPPYIGNSPANIGNYQVVDDISASFNGVLTTFPLTVLTLAINPPKSGQVLASINGVTQEPDDTGTNGFYVSGSNIVFSSAPATGATFWAVWQGQAVDIGTPSDDVVDTIHLKDDAVTAGKLANAINTDIATGVTGNTTANDALPKAGGTMTGTIAGFTSTGIDDNATSTAITIDSGEIVTIDNGGATPLILNRGGSNASLQVTSTVGGTVYFGTNSTGDGAIGTDSNQANALLKVKTTGDVEVRTGNLVIGTAGKGIDFSATGGPTNGTGTSELLDDYEEGFWVPHMIGSTVVGTATEGNYLGSYVKIGNQVTLSWYMSSTTLGGATGYIKINGLPFVSYNPPITNNNITTGSHMYDDLTVGATRTHCTPYISDNASYMQLYTSGDFSGWTNVGIQTGWASIGSITYRTA